MRTKNADSTSTISLFRYFRYFAIPYPIVIKRLYHVLSFIKPQQSISENSIKPADL